MKLQRFIITIFILCGLKTFASEVEEHDTKTYLNLSVTENTKIDQDLLVAKFRIVAENINSNDAQNNLNKSMEAASKIIKAVPQIEFTTGNYYTYQNKVDKDGKPIKVTYIATQDLMLQSTDAEKLLQIVSELQNIGFLAQGLNYETSNKKIEEVNDELLTKALIKLQDKAKLVAQNLNKQSIFFKEINVSNNHMPPYYPMPRVAMMKAQDTGEVSSPVVEAGKTAVSLTVSAKVAM